MDENERVERSQKLIELLKKLADPKLDVGNAKVSLAAELKEIYDYKGSGWYRHRYSEISRILYNQDITEEQCSLICDKLEELLKTLRKAKEDQFVAGSVEKLIDHISLESMRIGQMVQVLQGTEDLKSLVDQSSVIVEREQSIVQQSEHIYEQQKEIAQGQSESYKEIQKMAEEVEKTKDFVKSHHIQSITILGIFAGIVFAFSGGLTLLGGVFSSISNVSGRNAYLFVACIILVGIVLIDTIVVLLSFLGKYTGSSMKTFWPWAIVFINGLALGTAVSLLNSYLQRIK